MAKTFLNSTGSVLLKCNLDQKEGFKTTPKIFKEYLVHLWNLQTLSTN